MESEKPLIVVLSLPSHCFSLEFPRIYLNGNARMIDVREFFYNACHFTVGFPLHHSYILPWQKLTQCKVQKTSDDLGL